MGNPILSPQKDNEWEATATFSPAVIKSDNKYHLLYRAISLPRDHQGVRMPLSSIGCADSADGIVFDKRRLLISPDQEWDKFGCEDPRVTKIEDKYLISYTALSDYPHTPAGIKIGMALSKDLVKIEEKHQVTHFNSKALALFPERINGRIVAVLTVDTDRPPAKIALAYFEKVEQIWSREYWDSWLAGIDNQRLPLQRAMIDHIEVGAPPIKTDRGWLLLYSYIKNYSTRRPLFSVEAALLDIKYPLRLIARTEKPILVPEAAYERYGNVANIVFPTGAILEDKILSLYYTGADTFCCLARLDIEGLWPEMRSPQKIFFFGGKREMIRLERYEGNPIIKPDPSHPWESKTTFNPGALYWAGRVHIFYRAMDNQDTSVIGYAVSDDGFRVASRLPRPVYIPREDFERKAAPGNSGCEDPRLTCLGDKVYMAYVSYNGRDFPRVALTAIKLTDMLNRVWNWERPVVISPPNIMDKDACILSEKVAGRYAIFHRLEPHIWIDYSDELKFSGSNWLKGKIIMEPRPDKWDSKKVGIGAPPLKTDQGWLLIYHGVSSVDDKYRLGAALLSPADPGRVLARLDYPILEPETEYENNGLRAGTVFAGGAAIIKDRLFVYYGGADQVVCVASVRLNDLLQELSVHRLAEL